MPCTADPNVFTNIIFELIIKQKQTDILEKLRKFSLKRIGYLTKPIRKKSWSGF